MLRTANRRIAEQESVKADLLAQAEQGSVAKIALEESKVALEKGMQALTAAREEAGRAHQEAAELAELSKRIPQLEMEQRCYETELQQAKQALQQAQGLTLHASVVEEHQRQDMQCQLQRNQHLEAELKQSQAANEGIQRVAHDQLEQQQQRCQCLEEELKRCQAEMNQLRLWVHAKIPAEATTADLAPTPIGHMTSLGPVGSWPPSQVPGGSAALSGEYQSKLGVRYSLQ